MIKLKYSEFMSFGFQNAFQKLASSPFPSNIAYRIKKIGDEINRYREPVRKEYQDVLTKYAKKDEKGEFVHPDNGDPTSYDVPKEQIEAFKAEEKALGEKEITLSRLPIQSSDLGNLQFSAGEIAGLAGLVEFQDMEAVHTNNVKPIKAGA